MFDDIEYCVNSNSLKFSDIFKLAAVDKLGDCAVTFGPIVRPAFYCSSQYHEIIIDNRTSIYCLRRFDLGNYQRHVIKIIPEIYFHQE